MTQTQRERLSWDEFGVATSDLAQQVRDSGFTPSVVLSIARGGLVLGGALTYALDVALCDAINVEFYTEDADAMTADPVLLAPQLAPEAIAGQRVLVVDDVADAGRTLGFVMRLVRGFGADARSVVLFAKPTTVVDADFVWRVTETWVEFPWDIAR